MDNIWEIAAYLTTKDFVSLRSTSREINHTLNDYRFIQNADARTCRVVWEATTMREDILLLGPGGCGKTYTIQQMIKNCKEMDLKYAIVSSTGISACNFEGGCTLHSFSGLGLATMSLDDIRNKHRHTGNVFGGNKTWTSLDLLIIDEVSMIGRRFFEKVELSARLARGNNKPFGNLQLVCSGDYLQLPPVMDSFLFLSPRFKAIQFQVFYLDTPVRQQGDIRYFNLLQRVRKGHLSRKDCHLLMNRCVNGEEVEWKPDPQGFYAPKLYPKNKSIDGENQAMFDAVPGNVERVSHSIDIVLQRTQINGTYIYAPHPTMTTGEALTKVNKGFRVKNPDKISLKVGAQYFLTFNINVKKGFVNGACCLYEGNGVYLFQNGERMTGIREVKTRVRVANNVYLQREQLPLKLGYAVTIHSSQGMTLSKAIIDLGKNVFTHAQVYVALSRVRSLEGVYLLGFEPSKIRASQKSLAEYRRLGCI